MPKDFKERISGVTIRFEAVPTRAMMEAGVPADASSVTDRERKELTIFLMNLFTQYGGKPGKFKRALREAMVNELAELAGLEGGWAEED